MLLIIAISACKKEEDKLLTANAGTDQTVVPLELVELNGTATSSNEGYSILWSYDGDVPEGEINFQDVNTLTPTFIPPVPGLYIFTLTVSLEGQSNSDIVKVEAVGALDIGGTLSENLVLKNLEPDPEKPDYMISSDMVVPSGISCTIEDDGVVIQVQENTGIVIEQGGKFSNYDAMTGQGFETLFKSANGWKGILVQGGTLSLQNARLEMAGQSAFASYSEKGAVILTAGSILEHNFSNNVFSGSMATDFIMEAGVSADSVFTDNVLSNAIPLKVPFQYLSKVRDDNKFPSEYDYIHLIPKTDELETLTDYNVFKMSGEKYFIDGNLHLGASLYIEAGSQLYFKEGTGAILIDGYTTIEDRVSDDPVIMDGLDSAPWKGIALTGNSTLRLKKTQLINAGNGTFNTPLFQSEQPAAIYQANNYSLTVENTEIKNSGGYGIYYTGGESGILNFNLFNTIYQNTHFAAIRSTVGSLRYMLTQDHGNTFLMNDGVPAVLIEADEEFTEVQGRWPALGDDNYYLIDTDLKRFSDLSFRILPGAILKFTEDKQLIFDYEFADAFYFGAEGTPDNPIIFDSADPNAKWGGIRVNGLFIMKYCEIRNAGSNLLPDAPFPTNIFVNTDVQAAALPNQFKNCIISGSAGYGAIVNRWVQPGWDPGNPDNNIVFSNNDLGDIFYISD
jgi:hypothetical protein